MGAFTFFSGRERGIYTLHGITGRGLPTDSSTDSLIKTLITNSLMRCYNVTYVRATNHKPYSTCHKSMPNRCRPFPLTVTPTTRHYLISHAIQMLGMFLIRHGAPHPLRRENKGKECCKQTTVREKDEGGRDHGGRTRTPECNSARQRRMAEIKCLALFRL